MAAPERQAARIVEATSKAPAADPNEIDLDDDDSDDDGERHARRPAAAVFGSAAAQAASMSEPQGALARFQKPRRTINAQLAMSSSPQPRQSSRSRSPSSARA